MQQTSPPPTPEQQAALDHFATGKPLVLEAGAGTGKTTTLKMLAESSYRKGLYVAYNKAIATDAAGIFPAYTNCRTAHSLAYRAVGHKFRGRLGGGFQPWAKVASYLGIDKLLQAGDRSLTTGTQARLTMEMVGNFANSADPELRAYHRPFVEGLVQTNAAGEVTDYHDLLGEHLLPAASKAWDNLQKPDDEDSPVKFSHDHYLKMWQLASPCIDTGYILLDEAQDANPVIASIVAQQDCQIIAVGDRAQAIYGWRGAVDFMENGLPGAPVLYLSKSWRFGDAIAEVANTWLDQLDTPLRLTGNEAIDSEVWASSMPDPSAILCRSNAGALEAVLAAQADDDDVHLVGGATDISRFCEAATQLRNNGKTSHRDLVAFSSWDEVVSYAKESKAAVGDLGTWVNILERFSIDKVHSAIKRTVDPDIADVIISTAHKAKGREWDSVRIHSDFAAPVDETGREKPLSPAEIMLRYVAVTRAQFDLDCTALRPAHQTDEDQPTEERK